MGWYEVQESGLRAVTVLRDFLRECEQGLIPNEQEVQKLLDPKQNIAEMEEKQVSTSLSPTPPHVTDLINMGSPYHVSKINKPQTATAEMPNLILP